MIIIRLIYIYIYIYIFISLRAEIIHHARNQSLAFPQRLRPIFMTINVIVYLTLIMFWLLLFFFSDWRHTIDIIVGVFMSIIFLGAAAGFIVYGGRLYVMLKQFPIEPLINPTFQPPKFPYLRRRFLDNILWQIRRNAFTTIFSRQ